MSAAAAETILVALGGRYPGEGEVADRDVRATPPISKKFSAVDATGSRAACRVDAGH